MMLLDHMYMALITARQKSHASTILKYFKKIAPNTIKVVCLEAIYKYAFGDAKTAVSLVKGFLQDSQGEASLFKKYIDFVISDGNIVEAITCLNKFLYHFTQDADMWKLLGDLYSRLWSYDKAKFCYEELLMMQPDNSILFCRIGEMLLCMNEAEIAKKYLSEACCLDKDSTKSRWLLWLACSRSKQDAKNSELKAICGQQLLEKYKSNPIKELLVEVIK